jgi:uncharacterized protein (TIGR03382 family)
MRNNIVASCSDVGIYLNRAADTKLLFNTLVETSGIDFRFATSSGIAHGNLLSGAIRNREGAAHTAASNLASIPTDSFAAWYADAAHGDLRIVGDVTELIGKATAHADVSDDYCVRERPAAPTYGALEHAHGDCATVPPPGPTDPGSGGGGGAAGAGGAAGGAGGTGGAGGEAGTDGDGGTAGAGDLPRGGKARRGDGGCSTSGGADTPFTLALAIALCAGSLRRRNGGR